VRFFDVLKATMSDDSDDMNKFPDDTDNAVSRVKLLEPFGPPMDPLPDYSALARQLTTTTKYMYWDKAHENSKGMIGTLVAKVGGDSFGLEQYPIKCIDIGTDLWASIVELPDSMIETAPVFRIHVPAHVEENGDVVYRATPLLKLCEQYDAEEGLEWKTLVTKQEIGDVSQMSSVRDWNPTDTMVRDRIAQFPGFMQIFQAFFDELELIIKDQIENNLLD